MIDARDAKIIAARESWVDVDRFRFKIRRPTEGEWLVLQNVDGNMEKVREAVKRFIVDWANVLDSDLFSGGASDAAAFTHSSMALWIDDRVKFWVPIFNEIVNSFTAEQERRSAAEKNLGTS